MDDTIPFARRLRLRRLSRRDGPGLLVVPLDHAVGSGPLARPDLDGLLAQLDAAGTDAVILHKGALRRVDPARFRRMSLVLHLNASTALAPDPDAKYPVATVPEALSLGATAVSVHVNIGSATEDRQVGHLAEVAADCSRWGIPLLAMMYVRPAASYAGSAGSDPGRLAHALAVATELGADLVKTALPSSPAAAARVVGGCPVPVLAAGGAVDGDSFDRLAVAVGAGAGGIAAGRLVFTAPDPGAMVRRLTALLSSSSHAPGVLVG
ncbi:beta/alpha barrel domain-containing protein [Actinoplanes sp. RD1]|uniref:2-amino-4,5-dihydroxy-6-one-heptanoic acid-7-phosphate synthase n=1 Tax=Actinoplanes sp. RD1 TaxID=3064538 RepID=UPI0027403AC4|nr:2-amino-4,5-dihydroxy-6-one-heptanoic acid-7-phosphate synthase [Actinoplanes sp. RD1]